MNKLENLYTFYEQTLDIDKTCELAKETLPIITSYAQKWKDYFFTDEEGAMLYLVDFLLDVLEKYGENQNEL